VHDITAARRQLLQENPSMASLNEDEQREAVLGNFQNIITRLTRTGTGLVTMAEPNEPAPGWIAPKTDARALWSLFTSSWMNVLLITAPLGIAAHHLNWGPVTVFALNFTALIPLALLLGEVTEDLAVRFGETIGGLLNATFGNVVEFILSVAALSKGLYDVVAASLIGSILSNLLLVLGMCFLLGGAKHKQQKFNSTLNKACSGLLLLSCIALIIPTAARIFFDPNSPQHGKDEPIISERGLENTSHFAAILLGFVYVCYLFFQLKTHRDWFTGESDGEDTPALSLVAALGVLTGITLVVAVASEYLTGAIEAVSEKSGLNKTFLGLIILPIAGNAAEHITAVFVAMKNKMDLAIGVALGSSVQIAIFVFPAICLIGWIIGQPFLLAIDPFAAIVLTMSVVHAYFVSADGHANWLLGVLLISTYVLVGLLYLFVQNPEQNAP
jgi:Ca2+:H+ antiporter